MLTYVKKGFLAHAENLDPPLSIILCHQEVCKPHSRSGEDVPF
jgi:hypothetical protein